MTELPLRRLILYKHGVGYFERRGQFEGTKLTLAFSREAMDDVLKSLVVLEKGEGHVKGIDYERPESWSNRRIELGAGRPLRDLLTELRGRRIRLALRDEAAAEGLIVGIDEPPPEEPISQALVTIYRSDVRQITLHRLNDIRGVQLLDAAADEVLWSLRANSDKQDSRTATIQLDEGKHDLLVAYLAPAPSWRVSYRIIVDNIETEVPDVLLQGWGLFDNVLDEDLEDVRISLVAGRPVSFRYPLYEPQQPERPLIEDTIRPAAPPAYTLAAPAPAAAPRGKMMRAMAMQEEAFGGADFDALSLGIDEMASIAPVAEGASQGALFRYDVREPVSVGRGRSALVPLLNLRTSCRRELIYRGAAGEQNPMVTVRFENSSGLTLERGPITIMESRSYGGEAVLNWTAEGGLVTIRYAQALEVSVKENQSSAHQTRRLRLGRDVLIHEVEESLTTIYTATNTAGEARVIKIEHPLRHPYELFDTVQPAETTSQLASWLLPIPARGEAALRVRERRLIERREHIRSINFDQLRRYLHDRMLDQNTVSELREVLTLYARLDSIAQRFNEIEAARQKIYNQQTQIRGNLDVLKNEGGEGELRTRYITTLAETEDQLNALREEETTLRSEEAACHVKLEEHLSRFPG
ncbi:hypothetical protein [Herpetosiphon sp. NSE202]|uniref:hypothetical protein n=1 Tax=Herpetosiphon sp. NSE202 TaxID=3351349 RepID=UPI003625F2D8